MTPALQRLHKFGIGGILDYAAEDDVVADEGPASRNSEHDTVVARTFEYESEAKCEQHTGTFLKNIQAAAAGPGQGFAAIKVWLWLNSLFLVWVPKACLRVELL